MSLGKCKFEIWVQFLWEAVMISIIGMLLSFAISPIIAETSASYLAKETQTLRLEQQEQENTGTYIDGYIAPDLKIQDVEVHITKEMVLMDIGMISGILIIAVLVAGITIMKKRPKQILSETPMGMCKIFDNQDHGFWHWVIKPWFQPERFGITNIWFIIFLYGLVS